MTVRAPVSLLPLLRPATDADCTPLARVWRRAWCSANPSVALVAPLAHWEARVRAEFGPPCVTLVRAEGPEVTAFLVLDPAQAHVHQLFVGPDWQGQGVGAELVQQVHRLCPVGWTFHVATANSGARRFLCPPRLGGRAGGHPSGDGPGAGVMPVAAYPGGCRRLNRSVIQAASAASISPASFFGASCGA